MAYTISDLNYYKKKPKQINANLDIDLLLELIDFDASFLQYVKPQTFELIEKAYTRDPSSFRYIDFSKVTIQFLEKAIYDHPNMVKYVYSPSPDIMKIALTRDLNCLVYLEKYLDDKMYEWLLAQNGVILEFIPASKQTEKLVRIALHENPEAYKYSHIKNKEFDMLMVEHNPSTIGEISEYWEELIEPLIRYNPRFIAKFLDRPDILTMEIKKIAIDLDPMVYRILPNPDMEIMKYTAERDYLMMDYMPFSQELVDYIISHNGLALKYIKKKDLRTIQTAVEQNVLALDYVEYPRQFLIDLAFSLDGIALKYINNPTEEQCIDAVTRNPKAIEFVPDEFKTESLQNLALLGGPEMIPYIGVPASEEMILQIIKLEPSYLFTLENPTSLMIQTALGTFGRMIMFFPNWNETRTIDEIATALGQDGSILEFVKNKTKRLAMIAIQSYPLALQWIDFQDKGMIKLALSLDPTALYYVQPELIDEELLNLVLSLDPEYFTRSTGTLTLEEWQKSIGLL